MQIIQSQKRDNCSPSRFRLQSVTPTSALGQMKGDTYGNGQFHIFFFEPLILNELYSLILQFAD